jgi:hypothetical protein
MSKPSFRRVTASELRHLFNAGKYWERAQAQEFRQIVKKDAHPSPPKAPVPVCTRSQLIVYTDSRGHMIAMVHQYLQPDGTIGAGGRPDPKRLRVGDTVYYV